MCIVLSLCFIRLFCLGSLVFSLRFSLFFPFSAACAKNKSYRKTLRYFLIFCFRSHFFIITSKSLTASWYVPFLFFSGRQNENYYVDESSALPYFLFLDHLVFFFSLSFVLHG